MRFPDLRIGVVISLMTALAACSRTPAPPPVAADQAEVSPAPTSSARVSSTAFLRGYYEAREGGLFTACGETSRRQVTSIDEATAAALAKANANLDRPRFLMAEGNLSGKADVEIGRFNLISGDAWTCDSRIDDVVLAARGTDVLWSLEATPAAISFVPAPGRAPEVHGFAGLEASSDGLALSAADTGFSASLHAGSCIEAMTDTTYGWSIRVLDKGQTFDGCAWRGLAAP
ncbi:MAG TPA: hypothetical protein VFN25_12575 [Dokdonella sp.]|uniref:hypothetical protein n=1 Tax=Dokdonella sp. TaxID=2291710 RepID=UPI002D80919A|nr:hypothetical protein [Dokdonella sp.]HET9033726.1 hypothetical protein [Dokdonella sp.]